MLSVGSWAGVFRDGMAGAIEAGIDILEREEAEAAQQRRDERRHELEMKRIEREYELRAQEQARMRQQPTDQDDLRNRTQESLYRQFEAAHPDWRSIVKSQDFKQWGQRQPASVQSLAKTRRISDVILLIDLYKRDQMQKSDQK